MEAAVISVGNTPKEKFLSFVCQNVLIIIRLFFLRQNQNAIKHLFTFFLFVLRWLYPNGLLLCWTAYYWRWVAPWTMWSRRWTNRTALRRWRKTREPSKGCTEPRTFHRTMGIKVNIVGFFRLFVCRWRVVSAHCVAARLCESSEICLILELFLFSIQDVFDDMISGIERRSNRRSSSNQKQLSRAESVSFYSNIIWLIYV